MISFIYTQKEQSPLVIKVTMTGTPGRCWPGRGTEELTGVMENSFLDVVTQVTIIWKICGTLHVKYVHIVVCNLYTNNSTEAAWQKRKDEKKTQTQKPIKQDNENNDDRSGMWDEENEEV